MNMATPSADTSPPFGRPSLSGAYNMVYLAHFVRPNFAPLTLRKTSDIPRTLSEIGRSDV